MLTLKLKKLNKLKKNKYKNKNLTKIIIPNLCKLSIKINFLAKMQLNPLINTSMTNN